MSWLKSVASNSEDVFDEDMDDISLQNKEWKCNMEKRAKDGFRDGTDAGKEASLQVGFNAGYREGASRMNAVGQLKGIVSALQCWLQPQGSDSATLARVSQLLHRVEQHEEALVESMRRARERPPPASLPDLTEEMEDLGLAPGQDGSPAACCRNDGEGGCDGKDGGRGCCERDGEGGCKGQEKDVGGGVMERSVSLSSQAEQQEMEWLLGACLELVTQLDLPKDIQQHLQRLSATEQKLTQAI